VFCHQTAALERQQGVATAAGAQRRTERFLVQPLFLAWMRKGKCTRRGEFCIVYEVVQRRRKPSHLVLERTMKVLL